MEPVDLGKVLFSPEGIDVNRITKKELKQLRDRTYSTLKSYQGRTVYFRHEQEEKLHRGTMRIVSINSKGELYVEFSIVISQFAFLVSPFGIGNTYIYGLNFTKLPFSLNDFDIRGKFLSLSESYLDLVEYWKNLSLKNREKVYLTLAPPEKYILLNQLDKKTRNLFLSRNIPTPPPGNRVRFDSLQVGQTYWMYNPNTESYQKVKIKQNEGNRILDEITNIFFDFDNQFFEYTTPTKEVTTLTRKLPVELSGKVMSYLRGGKKRKTRRQQRK